MDFVTFKHLISLLPNTKIQGNRPIFSSSFVHLDAFKYEKSMFFLIEDYSPMSLDNFGGLIYFSKKVLLFANIPNVQFTLER